MDTSLMTKAFTLMTISYVLIDSPILKDSRIGLLLKLATLKQLVKIVPRSGVGLLQSGFSALRCSGITCKCLI